VVRLVAFPHTGYRFVNWTGDVGSVDSVNAASTTITMDGDHSITANFVQEEAVYFTDPNLEAAVKEAVRKSVGPVCPSDLEGLTCFEGGAGNIINLVGLEHCTRLTHLELSFYQISDISPLTNLTSLTWLRLDNDQISDISPLADLTNLTWLRLDHNQISDVSPLADLTNLTYLYLGDNRISDIDDLASLTGLQYLSLHDNEINDISPLVNNPGVSSGDTVVLVNNPLGDTSINRYIPQLQARGVTVYY
jgi:hypothetical protein